MTTSSRRCEQQNVRYWPLTDMSLAPSNVCFRSKAGIELTARNARNDPKRTLGHLLPSLVRTATMP
jgi:hypothetical protein